MILKIGIDPASPISGSQRIMRQSKRSSVFTSPKEGHAALHEHIEEGPPEPALQLGALCAPTTGDKSLTREYIGGGAGCGFA
jgi:hypothetical protein